MSGRGMKPTVPVVAIQGAVTLRVELQPEDLLIWLRFRGALSGNPEPTVLDFWSCREHVPITVTNRSADLPTWFQLHPTEVSGALAYRMMRQLEAGYVPGPPLDGPHIWRVLGGDRLVHCCRFHGPQPVRIDGLVSVYAFHENAAVTTAHSCDSVKDWITFGAPDHGVPSPAELRAGQSAVAAVKGLGPPREISTAWTLSW
jgi:hypothetical protein